MLAIPYEQRSVTYGDEAKSTSVPTDYSQEKVVEGVLAVLRDTGRDQAIWAGHDWGCATLSYMAFYEQSFDKAIAFQNKSPHSMLRCLFREPEWLPEDTPSPRANVVKQGGWFGGIDSPPPPSTVKNEEIIMKLDVFQELVAWVLESPVCKAAVKVYR
ncbi:hypothetical protein V8C34DRAFT_306644 [Trichoderma compactum]